MSVLNVLERCTMSKTESLVVVVDSAIALASSVNKNRNAPHDNPAHGIRRQRVNY